MTERENWEEYRL